MLLRVDVGGALALPFLDELELRTHGAGRVSNCGEAGRRARRAARPGWRRRNSLSPHPLSLSLSLSLSLTPTLTPTPTLTLTRYADFLDLCTALTGRAPHAGAHLAAARAPTLEVRVAAEVAARADELLYPALGYACGLQREGGASPLALG